MTPLEQRYRKVLRLLPADYRERWGDDMVETFLAGMRQPDPDDDELVQEIGRPDRAEIASVAALAVRVRLGAPAENVTNSAAAERGTAVRLAVLAFLLAQASGAALNVFVLLWRRGLVPGLAPPDGDWMQAAGGLAGVLWLPAFLALLAGRVRWAARITAVAVGLTGVLTAVGVVQDGPVGVAGWVFLLLDVLVLVGLLAFEDGTPAARPRAWLVGLAVGVVGLPVYVAVAVPVHGPPPALDWIGLACLAVAAAAAFSLRAEPGRRQAILLLTAGVLLLRVAATADYFRSVPAAERTPILLAGAAETLLLLAFAVAIAWKRVGVGATGHARVDDRG